jgi:hypothetical protein
VKNLVNWRHSMLASRFCKICGEKHPRAFVKVVEGSGIYNFLIHHFVHFNSNFWRFLRLNSGTVNLCRAGDSAPRRAATSRATRPRARTAPASASGPTEMHPEVPPLPEDPRPEAGEHSKTP